MANVFTADANEHVANSMATIQNAIISLEESLRSTESVDNKQRIQAAITSLQEAGKRLNAYQG